MVDNTALRALKWLVRAAWSLEYALRRRASRGPWSLAGECQRCAKCCESPSIVVGRITRGLPALRRLFLAWQRRVNGFVLERVDADSGTFTFRCSHFDWASRACDSYGSRPFMCRDYPRSLLGQPWPELLDGCGYRAHFSDGGGLAAAIDNTSLSPEARAELKRRLRLE